MDRNDARVGRRLVVAGFSLLALSTGYTLVRLISQGYFGVGGLSSTIETMMSALATMVAVWAWWWMTLVRVIGSAQARVLRRGLYGLSAQYVLSFGLYAMMLISVRTPGATLVDLGQWWIGALGAISTAVGFFAMARTVVASSDDGPSWAVDEYPDPGD